jgi:ABC-type nitrate/sulfonate/bicarbonate transport system substrate-binding protein
MLEDRPMHHQERISERISRAWRALRLLPLFFALLATLFAALLAALMPAPSAAQAVETITAGAVGSASTTIWPVYIGIEKGFFAQAQIKVDPVFAQSSTAIAQQVAAGSVNLTVGSGLVDPIRAIEKGAPIAIWRIDMQAPPYALLAKRDIKGIKELKGKTIIIGGPKDITRIFVERMLAPNGIGPGDVDYVFAGATSARLSALQSGAVDAALLTSPHNFHAEAAGFTNLGWTIDYAKELPFSGGAVNRAWAGASKPTLDRFITAYDRSVGWFQDGRNRDEAIRIMVGVSKLDRDDVGKSYDFLQQKNFYELTGKISKSKLDKLIAALRQLGDLPPSFAVEQLVMPGVGELTE